MQLQLLVLTYTRIIPLSILRLSLVRTVSHSLVLLRHCQLRQKKQKNGSVTKPVVVADGGVVVGCRLLHDAWARLLRPDVCPDLSFPAAVVETAVQPLRWLPCCDFAHLELLCLMAQGPHPFCSLCCFQTCYCSSCCCCVLVLSFHPLSFHLTDLTG